MKLVSKRAFAVLSVAAVSVVGLGSAHAATVEHPVRVADLDVTTAHQDADSTYTFLKEGLHVQVKNADSSTSFARALFDTDVPLANVHTVTFDWFGTGYGSQTAQAGQVAGGTGPVALRYNVDVDGDGAWDCQLVGEEIYGGKEVWLNRDTDRSPKMTLEPGSCAAHAPHTGPGHGGDSYGDLDDWATSLATIDDQAPDVVQAGFVGSDVLVDGVLRSISLGDNDVYTFTDEAAPSEPGEPTDVRASYSRTVTGNKFQLTFTSDELAEGATQGVKVLWQVKIGNEGGSLSGRLRLEQGAGETSVFTERFESSQPRQTIQVLKNGDVVGTYMETPR